MSAETSAWAKEQRCGDPVTKAVLMEIANWAKPTGTCEFLSIKRLAEVVEVSPRTVQRHIARLEDPDPTSGGLGMIRRVIRRRDDGGQSANSFELIGYEPPLALAQSAQRNPLRQSVTPPRHADAPPCQIDREPGDNHVTRLGDKIKNTLSPPNGVDVPQTILDQDLLGEGAPRPPDPAGRERAHRLPADWQAPPLADLPPEARALAAQWPSGAYAAYAANFRGYWTDVEPKRRTGRGWAATFANWVTRVHSDVMRAGKAGISFAPITPAKPAAARAVQPVAALAHEGPAGQAIRAALRGELGAQISATWLDPAAFLINGDVLAVIAPSEFMRGWIEDRFAAQIKAAAGPAVRTIRFSTETPSTPAKGQ